MKVENSNHPNKTVYLKLPFKRDKGNKQNMFKIHHFSEVFYHWIKVILDVMVNDQVEYGDLSPNIHSRASFSVDF